MYLISSGRTPPVRLSLGGEALFDGGKHSEASDFLKSEVDSVQNTGDATQDPSAMIQELERLSSLCCRASKRSVDPDRTPGRGCARAEPAAPGPGGEARHASGPGTLRGRLSNGKYPGLHAHGAAQGSARFPGMGSRPIRENDASLCSEIAKNGFVILFHPVGGVEDVPAGD